MGNMLSGVCEGEGQMGQMSAKGVGVAGDPGLTAPTGPTGPSPDVPSEVYSRKIFVGGLPPDIDEGSFFVDSFDLALFSSFFSSSFRAY